ncbi:MAG: tripartite tricarboxylate transporter TctB family protein [Lautropia sp.]
MRIAIAVGLMAWTLDLLRQSLQIDQLRVVVSAAGGYPIWILCITTLLIGTVLVTDLIPAARRGRGDASQRTIASASDRARLYAFLLLWIAYIALLPIAGFLVSTAVATWCSVLLLDRKARWWKVALGAVVFALGVEILFRTVFYVSLPASIVDEWVDAFLFLF